jgi:ribosomal protein S18 acetylase RimI-like enzyme
VRTWQTAYRHIFPPQRLGELSVEQRAAQWRQHPPLVAVAADVVVGFVSVGARRDDDGTDGELFAIYVDPDHWGSGAGRDLIVAGEKRLSELGYTDAILWVLEDNPRARRFYERAGWSADGGRRLIAALGIEVSEVRYVKQLERNPWPIDR